jgi:hypothetical protein
MPEDDDEWDALVVTGLVVAPVSVLVVVVALSPES